MSVTLLGIVTLIRLGQSKNVSSPMLVTLVGIVTPDRKSTRLNSSHLVISYAVFCLKKEENSFDPTNLYKCNHLLRCSTSALISPVGEVDCGPVRTRSPTEIIPVTQRTYSTIFVDES